MTNGTSSITVIRMSGELDIVRKQECRETLQLRGNESAILLDFSDVPYADSSALAEVFRFYTEAERAQIPLAVLIISSQFARIVEYAGLASVIPIFNERGAALIHLGALLTK
jgi:anti-anti-sigma factor